MGVCVCVNLGAHVPTPYVASQGRIQHVSESRLVMSAYAPISSRAYFNVPTGTDVLGDLKSVLEGLVTRA